MDYESFRKMKSSILPINPVLATPFARFLFSFSLFFFPVSSFYSPSLYTSPISKHFSHSAKPSEAFLISDFSSPDFISQLKSSLSEDNELIADNWMPSNSNHTQQHHETPTKASTNVSNPTSPVRSSNPPNLFNKRNGNYQSVASMNSMIDRTSAFTAMRQQNQNVFEQAPTNHFEEHASPQHQPQSTLPSLENVAANSAQSNTKEAMPTMGSSHSSDSFVEVNERRAYLATYPRSGNHWVRYMVEEATHIATSSVMCDFNPQHLETPFEWGGYCADQGYEGHCRYAVENETVLIKTHFPALPPREFDQQPYFKTIRIIRHPVDSFYSHYVFNQMMRVRFNISEPLVLNAELLQEFIQSWREFQEYWDQQPNVLTFRYEDMLENPGPILKLILRTLDYDDSNEHVQRAVAKHPPIGEPLKHLSQFTEEELELINDSLSDLMIKYDYTIPLPKSSLAY